MWELFTESYFINTTYYRRARVIVIPRYFALFMPVVMLYQYGSALVTDCKVSVFFLNFYVCVT